MRVTIGFLGLVAIGALLLSCGDRAVEQTPTGAPDAVQQNAVPEGQPETGVLTLTAEGGPIEPPVEVSRIPEGAWYCDMGTVHFARLDMGDVKCPLCGMTLVQKTEETGATSGTSDHESHDG